MFVTRALLLPFAHSKHLRQRYTDGAASEPSEEPLETPAESLTEAPTPDPEPQSEGAPEVPVL